MPYTYDKQKTGQGQDQNISAGQMNTPGTSNIPNSAMSGLLHQVPSAEAEADRLSAGINASEPNAVKREMGARLGADFSSVNMHTDADSVSKADHMGARAMAQGNDIYFGQGGFDPEIAAHELVHTVQQGTVQGAVNQTAPTGSVQLWPFGKKSAKKDSKKKPPKLSKKEKSMNEKLDMIFRRGAAHNADNLEKTAYKKALRQSKTEEFYAKYISNGLPEKEARQKAADDAEDYISANKRTILASYNRQITQEDDDELANLTGNLNEDEIKMVFNRRHFEATKLAKIHNSIMKREGNPTDKTQQDKILFLASQNKAAYNYNVLDYIVNYISMINDQDRVDKVKKEVLADRTPEEKAIDNLGLNISISIMGDNLYFDQADKSVKPAREAEKDEALKKEMEYQERIKRGEETVSYDRYYKDPEEDEEDEEQVHDSGRSIFLDDAEIVADLTEDEKRQAALLNNSKKTPPKLSKKEKRLNEKVDSVFRKAAAFNAFLSERHFYALSFERKKEQEFFEKYVKEGTPKDVAKENAHDDALDYALDHAEEAMAGFKRTITEKEEEDFMHTITNMTADEIKLVLERRLYESNKLLKIHDSMSKREGNPTDKIEKDRINFLASQNETRYNFDVIDLIVNQLSLKNRRMPSVMDAFRKAHPDAADKTYEQVMQISSSGSTAYNKYTNPKDPSLKEKRKAESEAVQKKEMEYFEKIQRGEIKVSYDRYYNDSEEEVEQAHDSGRSILLDDSQSLKSPAKDKKEPVAPKQAGNDSFSDNSGYGIPSRKGSQTGPSIEENLIIDTHSNKSAYEEDDDNFDKNKNNDPLSRLNEMDPVKEIGDPLLDLPIPTGQKSSGGSKPGSIDEQIDVLKSRAGKDKSLTIDQQMLLQAFEHAKRVDKTNDKVGGVKAGAAGVGLAMGFVAATGPVAPVTAAAMGLAGITGGIGALIFDKRKKKQMRNNIVLDYLGMNSWEEIENLARKMTKSPKLSAKAARGVYLKSHGLGRNRDEAFKIIVEKRADFLIKKAESGDKDAELAQNVISKLGIERKKGKYGKSALKKLMSRLS